MKERKNVQQAYADAMRKMSMPATLDTEKQIITSGTSKIRIKSRALAYAAVAAALAVCVGVGAMIFTAKNADIIDPVNSSADLRLEKDQTIPVGEITSVEQAVQEHRKCMLLKNDEYIRLMNKKGDIAVTDAMDFKNRCQSITQRNEECLYYIAQNFKSTDTLFVHAVKYDDGYIDLSFILGSRISEQAQQLLNSEHSYYICDAKTGEKILRCVTDFGIPRNDLSADTSSNIGTKLEKSDLEKLKGELSFVMFGKDEKNERLTILENFTFTDKLFIASSERSELEKQAEQAFAKLLEDKSDSDRNGAVNITADKVVCAPHSIYMRVTLTAKNDTGKQLLKFSYEDKTEGHKIFLAGSGDNMSPAPSGTDNYSEPDWECSIFEESEDVIGFDCYIPLRSAPTTDLSYTLTARITDPNLTDEQISNGESKSLTIASIDIPYKLSERVPETTYYCGGKKILLSKTGFVLSSSTDDALELTLKAPDGSVKRKITENDITRYSIETTEERDSNDKTIATHRSFLQWRTADDVRTNFFKRPADVENVASIVYAGEEYTLTKTPEYKTAEQAQKAFEQAYNAQLDILAKYSKQIAQLTEPDGRKTVCRQLCEQYDGYDKTIKNAGKQLAKLNGGKCLHAGKTTAGEIVFGMWYDESFPTDFTLAKECLISTDKEAKNVILKGRTMYEFMASPQIAIERNNYMTLVSDNSGNDLTKLKTGQTYYITFNDENYKTNGKHITKEFTLTSDTPEMSMNDRFVTILPQMRQYAYSTDTL